MQSTFSNPEDLAKLVASALTQRELACPELAVLIKLFEIMFQASLKTEEGQSISFSLNFLDPQNPDPDPPRRTQDHWIFVEFDNPLLMTISNLVKIAKATDPRTSSFVVYPVNDLYIWGLLDQQNLVHKFLNHESERGPSRPGLFQASVIGVGHIIVYLEYDKVAELKINRIITHNLDIFESGPVYQSLYNGLKDHLEGQLLAEIQEDSYYENLWMNSLRRLLIRIQNYRHGGSILLTPDPASAGLNIKYSAIYPRLNTSLTNYSILSRERSKLALNNLFSSGCVSKEAYRQEGHMDLLLEESKIAIENALWFISLLSRVDGTIIMNPKFEVLGFGAEITYSEPPHEVWKAMNINGTKLEKVDYNHFGTRHRSVMRYCSKVKNSLGFVISQDGDVRVINKIKNKLIIWEDIKLQLTFSSVTAD